ncbi:MAG: succinylglutamate desuccinylase/aspartoacylase family protein [Myxococcales bacterium]|nr:succinylglutamate desuccinylase/aspartoacylase family protein [Myxococcales bacterium]
MPRLPAGIHHLTPTVPVHVFDAPEPGPTALIQAGIHGDEVAGVHALQEMLEAEVRPARGRLIVIPVMNPAAYRARERCGKPSASGWAGLDLNRCFPGDAEAPAFERRLAAMYMQLVRDERPALMATLHESYKRYDPKVTPSFGQTIVYGVDPAPPVVARLVDRLNHRFNQPGEHWDPQYYPVATSSTEVIVAELSSRPSGPESGCVGLCVETWMGFAEQRRVEMQRGVVEILLDEFGLLPNSTALRA